MVICARRNPRLPMLDRLDPYGVGFVLRWLDSVYDKTVARLSMWL